MLELKGASLVVLGSVFLLAAATVALVSNESLTLSNASLAVVIAVAGALPLLKNLESANPMPLYAMTMAYHGVTFGWMSLPNSIDWLGASQESIGQAFLLALAGMAAIAIGFRYWRLVGALSLRPRLWSALSGINHTRVLWSLISINVVVRALIYGGISPGLFTAIRLPVEWTGLCLGWILLFQSRLGRLEKWGMVSYTVALALLELVLTSLKPLVTIGLVLAFAYMHVHRRPPFVGIFVAVLLFLLLNPAKSLWRSDAREHLEGDPGPVQSATALLSAVSEYYFGDGPQVAEPGAVRNSNRLCNTPTLVRIVDYTPVHVDYLGGATIDHIFTPRFLFPDKPPAEFGNYVGHRYDLLAPRDMQTIISVSWVADLYQNFGGIGVFVGCFLIGCALGALEYFFGSREASPLAFSVGVGVGGLAFMAGEGIALMWGGLLVKIALLAVVIGVLVSVCRMPQAAVA